MSLNRNVRRTTMIAVSGLTAMLLGTMPVGAQQRKPPPGAYVQASRPGTVLVCPGGRAATVRVRPDGSLAQTCPPSRGVSQVPSRQLPARRVARPGRALARPNGYGPPPPGAIGLIAKPTLVIHRLSGPYYEERVGTQWVRRGVFRRNPDGSLLYTGGGYYFLPEYTRYLVKNNRWYVAINGHWTPWRLGGLLDEEPSQGSSQGSAITQSCGSMRQGRTPPTDRQLEALQKACGAEALQSGLSNFTMQPAPFR
jgi:hypothetical protein